MSQSSQSSRDIIAMVLAIICGEMSVFHHGHHRLLAIHYHHRSGHGGLESHWRGHHMCFSKFDQDYHWKGVLLNFRPIAQGFELALPWSAL